MAKDRYITATGNLRADQWADWMHKVGTHRRLALAHAKAFFDAYPRLPIKQMDFLDYLRAHPDCPFKTVPGLKAHRTSLLKLGII